MTLFVVIRSMKHKDVLRQIGPDRMAVLSSRSDAAGLWHLAGHLGVIAVLTALILYRVPGWPALLVVQGLALVFLFTLQHECTHQTPFRTRWINEVIGHLCGVVLLQPFLWFRYFHLAHHRHTNDPDRDPELEGGGAPTSPGRYLLHVTGLPV